MAVNEGDILRGLDLGVPKDDVKQAAEDAIEKVLDRWVDLMIEDLRSNMKDKGIYASGGSAASLTPKIRIGDKSAKVEVFGDAHIDFIEEGVNGAPSLDVVEGKVSGSPYSFKYPRASRKMAQEIQNWIPFTGMSPKPGQSFTSMAYAIATAVKKKGIKPRPFLEKTFTQENLDELGKAISQAMGTQIIASFNKRTGNK